LSGGGPLEPTEHHLEVVKTARYWSIGGPGAEGDGLWIVLHGYKQLARRFLRRFEPIAGPRCEVVAPEALSRFYVERQTGRHGPESVVGATWMTREDRLNEIRDYVRYLDRVADEVAAERRRLTVLGFSQGAATATRWVVEGRHRPARLLLWGEVLPHDLDPVRGAEALRDVELVLVRGSEDRALTPERVAWEAGLLESAGIVHRVVTYDGGHEIDPATLSELVGD
jgi:predicted esterase